MSSHNSSLRSLLSPARCGTFFAPFRSRSANPDGFDSKMKLWICAIEEWAVSNKKLTLCIRDIHQTFLSDAGIRPDKECIRLVFSEMKRKSLLVPFRTLKTSILWSSSTTTPLLDNFIDPKSWLSWGVKKLVYNPASWAVSAIVKSGDDQTYSDLTDMSITDDIKFVCCKSLNELSQRLLDELIRISKAEKQSCFEWQHLLELITPIISTIIDTTDSKELLELLDILIEYLTINKHVSTLVDNDTRLVKISNPEDSSDDEVNINKKDIAIARLLRAKELLTADADKCRNQALRAQQDALEFYKNKQVAKAKSLLRSNKRLEKCAEQKEIQLTNVEIMLDQLENTDSNAMILQAYKGGADALRAANAHFENNRSILDDMYDITAETRDLNEEMNQMLKDISCVSQSATYDNSNLDLEAELNDYITTHEQDSIQTLREQHSSTGERKEADEEVDNYLKELEQKLDDLVVCDHDPNLEIRVESTPKKHMAYTAT